MRKDERMEEAEPIPLWVALTMVAAYGGAMFLLANLVYMWAKG